MVQSLNDEWLVGDETRTTRSLAGNTRKGWARRKLLIAPQGIGGVHCSGKS